MPMLQPCDTPGPDNTVALWEMNISVQEKDITPSGKQLLDLAPGYALRLGTLPFSVQSARVVESMYAWGRGHAVLPFADLR
jgi:hypothetical protein